MDIPVLIPAYNPDETLCRVVDGLIKLDFKHIIVVNDGSKPGCDAVFAEVEKKKQCHVLRHAVNSGKGRALKTGFNYYYLTFPDTPGLVTADADGQHRAEDILRVAQTLMEQPDKLIMGARQLGKDIPFRSLFGNTLTRFVFSWVIGRKISDTQSGLRGLPRSAVPHLLKIKGERYEYEINMLIFTKEKAVDIVEVPIETIYIEENKSSHFNPFFDSMKIYFQLLRYAFSSLLTSFCDFIVFTIMFKLTANMMLSLLVARFVVGSMLNYVINRRLVFHSRTGVFVSLMKYYFALLVMSVLSYLLISRTVEHLGISVVAAKIMVETLLFVFTFVIQRDFVFQTPEEDI